MKKAANRKRPAVNKVYYIYVGILAVLFFIFHTIPFLKGVFYSFTDWRGYGDWNFVGLRNYLHMFVDADTGNAYIFTFKFAVKPDRGIHLQLYFCKPDPGAWKNSGNRGSQCEYPGYQQCDVGNHCSISVDRMCIQYTDLYCRTPVY